VRQLAQQGFVALIAVLLATSMVAPVALADHTAAPTDDQQLNYSADAAPNVYAHADTVQIDEHDRATMSSPLEYYDDNGDASDLANDGAEMNESLTLPVGVNFSKVKDMRYRTFPRLSGEDGNDATWTDASNWTTSSSTDGSITVSNTTIDGSNVSGVEFDVTDASTSTTSDNAEATYSRVDITSDATKRVPQVGANVDLGSPNASATIRYEDGDGDYVAFYVNQSGDASTNESVLTSSNATGVVAQEKVSDLPVEGNGDGTMDGIQKVDVYVEGTNADATIEIFWLDAAKKSTEDLLETERDTDGDGEQELTMIEDKWTDGPVRTTGLDTMPSWASDATIFDLDVHDVSFPISNVADAHNNISLGDHPTYDGGEVDAYWRHTVPAEIDLSYTNLTLLADQTAPSDRYETVEYGTAVGETNFTNVSYTAATSNFDDEGQTVILVSNLNAGEEWAAHVEQALTQPERDALTDLSAVAGGPTGGGGGGFFSTIFGQITGAIAALGAALGLNRIVGGGS
jgi:hypothetical protein